MKRNVEVTTDLKTPYRTTSVYTLSMVAVIGAYLIMGIIIALLEGKVDYKESLIYFCANYFLVSVALFVGFIITYRKQNLVIYDVTNVKFGLKFVWIIILVAFGALFGLSSLNDYFVAFLEKFGYVADMVTLPEKSFASVTSVIIFVAVIPAVMEELVFRGLLLKGAENFGKIQAVLVTAAAFSLYHTSPAQTIYQFVIGVIYGFVALSSGSVIPTTILHFLNNFVIIVIYYFFPSFALEGSIKIIVTILGVLAVAVALFITLKGVSLKKEDKNDKASIVEYVSYLAPGFLICLVMWITNLFA